MVRANCLQQMKKSNTSITEPSPGYALLDSGEGEKLERFGEHVLSRPDPQALWPKNLPISEWKKADASFARGSDKGEWKFSKKLPEKWEVTLGGLKFWIKPTAFKHTGLFPEQEPNWKWMSEKIKARRERGERGSEDVEVLNLFGYTGGATLACASAGAKVVHIDGSKSAVTWARENAALSGLEDKPVRWITEDSRTFVEREIRRGRKYDGIVMDPPSFGHGPSSELWKIEEDFLSLVENCKKLLKSKPLFFLINGYAAGYSATAYGNNLLDLKVEYGGDVETGELFIKEEEGAPNKAGTSTKAGAQNKGGAKAGNGGRLLPAGIYARWGVSC